MTGRRGRGRRDNGLDATLWSPLRDVDPRVGEHLLDLLHAVGIAAYLEPSADVEPYTRTVSLPSPPSDRLFVDRARRAEARDRRRRARPAGPRGGRRRRPRRSRPPPAGSSTRTPSGRASWRRSRPSTAARWSAEEPADAPPPPPSELPVLDRPDEHYEPPPPPPIPAPAPASLYAVLLVAAGVLLDRGARDAEAVRRRRAGPRRRGIAGGVAMLVSRMRDRSDDDGDDGAVV